VTTITGGDPTFATGRSALADLCNGDAQLVETYFNALGWYVSSIDHGFTKLGHRIAGFLPTRQQASKTDKPCHVVIRLETESLHFDDVLCRFQTNERILVISDLTSPALTHQLAFVRSQYLNPWLYFICGGDTKGPALARLDPDGISPIGGTDFPQRAELSRDFATLLSARRMVQRCSLRGDVSASREASARWIHSIKGAPTKGVTVQSVTSTARILQPETVRAGSLIYIHGGGLVHYDIDLFTPFLSYLATLLEAPIIALGYEKCPETPAGHVIDALMADVSEIAKQMDVHRIMGDSIGGLLSLYAALRHMPHQFDDVTLLYPVLSMRSTYPSFERFSDGYLLDAEDMRWFRSLISQRFLAEDFDPLNLSKETLSNVRLLVISAGCDVLTDEAFAFSRQTSAELITFAELPHDFCLYFNKVSSARKAVEDFATLIRQPARTAS